MSRNLLSIRYIQGRATRWKAGWEGLYTRYKHSSIGTSPFGGAGFSVQDFVFRISCYRVGLSVLGARFRSRGSGCLELAIGCSGFGLDLGLPPTLVLLEKNRQGPYTYIP